MLTRKNGSWCSSVAGVGPGMVRILVRLVPARLGLRGWTRTALEGLTVTNAPGVPQGIPERNGQLFLPGEFWNPAGQDRQAFSRSLGIVAVAPLAGGRAPRVLRLHLRPRTAGRSAGSPAAA